MGRSVLEAARMDFIVLRNSHSSTAWAHVVSTGDSEAKKVRAGFVTTRWTQVAEAAASQAPASRKALEELFETYWLPVYAFIRRSGYDANQASDLTQGFFVSVLERGLIGKADQTRGRFRTFLLVAVKGFLANEHRAANTLKRGGQQQIVSIDAAKGDERIGIEPQVTMPPDREFQRQWALTVLQRAMDQLADEFARRDRSQLFQSIKSLLTGDSADSSYEKISQQLGMSENSIKVAVHRMRKRYRELIRIEVSQTVQGEDEVQDELNELLRALGDQA